MDEKIDLQNDLSFILGKIITKLDEIENQIRLNNDEHKIILDRLNNNDNIYALKADLRALADKHRVLEAKVNTLELLPTKKKSDFLDGLGKKSLSYLIAGVGLFLIMNLDKIFLFFQGLVK